MTIDGPEHYCTYFDRRFLSHGIALATSLQQHCPNHLLWVLCLDDYTAECIESLATPNLRTIRLAQLEASDPTLAATRHNRTIVEYYFTLSPCWPRYLLAQHPEIKRLTYLDADLYFFASPQAVFEELGNASILITEHNFPAYLQHHLRFGRFNVGILVFVNDKISQSCLNQWRKQCIDWCSDCIEPGRYADQKYLDEWPALYGNALKVYPKRGVNLAPWNWDSADLSWHHARPQINGEPLTLFHFARFRPTLNTRVFQSGHLEYGVMPWCLRQFIYGTYWKALVSASKAIASVRPDYKFTVSTRGWHAFYRALIPRLIFGSDWLRIGSCFISGRLGLGRYSGRTLAFFKSRRSTDSSE